MEQPFIQDEREQRRGQDRGHDRQRLPTEMRKQAGERGPYRDCQDGKGENQPELRDATMLSRRGLRLLVLCIRPLAHRRVPPFQRLA